MILIKRLFFAYTLSFFFTTADAQNDTVYIFSYFKGNGEDGLHLAYSLDGLKFKALNNDKSLLKPEISRDKLMRDPCIIKGPDGLFHMTWSVSWAERGIGYASSSNLKQWSPQLYIPVMEHEPGALNAWAPEITYDAKKKRYIIYWASTIPGRFPETDSSGDGNYNHRMYYTTTADFKNFGSTLLLYNKGFNVIDATIQSNGDEYIMFLKDETKRPSPQKNIRIAVSKNITDDYSAPSSPITGSYWAEGPTAIKIKGKWMVYFDKYMNHQYGLVTSTDLKHWDDISPLLQMPDGIRHGSILAISKKEFDQFFGQ